MSEASLRRYTNLPSTLHILQNQCLTLLNPSSWDDRNDAFYIEEYRKGCGAKSVLAICFAESAETHHHRSVFSGGTDGICIEFDKEELEAVTRDDADYICKSVDYREIKDAKITGLALDELPFVKRYPYIGEKEFRILFIDRHDKSRSQRLQIPLDMIIKITLSPWMPDPIATAVKLTLKSIKGCGNIQVYKSSLIESHTWKRIAKPNLKKQKSN